MINNDEAQRRVETAMKRDPRLAPYGYLSGGSFVLDSTRIFQWFENVDELVDHIREVDPVVFDLDTEEFESFQSSIIPILDAVRSEGMSDELLEKLNDQIKDHMKVDWWGCLNDLISGESEFSTSFRADFQDYDGERRSDSGEIIESELESFVEFIKSYGY